jgi:hypothetical protein
VAQTQRRLLTIAAAIVGPVVSEFLFLELLKALPLTDAPTPVGVAFWLSVPVSIAAVLAVGYRLIRREWSDPRRNLALVYFSLMLPALLLLTYHTMIVREWRE